MMPILPVCAMIWVKLAPSAQNKHSVALHGYCNARPKGHVCLVPDRRGGALAFNSTSPQQALIRRACAHVAVSAPSDGARRTDMDARVVPFGENGILRHLSGKTLELIEPHLHM